MEFNTKYITKKYSSWINTKEYIILHHTASDLSTPDINVVKYLSTSTAQVSCHYIVGTDWVIYQLTSDDKITWHAWLSEWKWKKWLNAFSIGIEIISDWKTFNDNQRKATRELVKYLMDKYSIDSSSILRHKDIAPWRKTDVGDSFWNNEYKTYSEYQQSFIIQSSNLQPEAQKAKDLWLWNGERPNDPTTREETAVMMSRVYDYLNK